MSKSNSNFPTARVLAGLRSWASTAAKHTEIMLLIGIVLALLVGGSYWGWQLLALQGANDPHYRVVPNDIIVTTRCEWITVEDLKQEVIRDGSLDQQLSILDENLTQRIALAFEAHPWVRKTARVEKFHPARVEVTLEYRVPVAVVSYKNQNIPVDDTGTILPSDNFAPYRLQRFPIIRGDHLPRPATPGGQWDDDRVIAAALIAATFGSAWHEYNLAEIVPSKHPTDDEYAFTYELVTRSGTRIPWGRQFLAEHRTEPGAGEKLDHLRRYIDVHGSLDGLTFDSSEQQTPRTASRKLPVPD